jgi:hypothetical protein
MWLTHTGVVFRLTGVGGRGLQRDLDASFLLRDWDGAIHIRRIIMGGKGTYLSLLCPSEVDIVHSGRADTLEAVPLPPSHMK